MIMRDQVTAKERLARFNCEDCFDQGFYEGCCKDCGTICKKCDSEANDE